MKQLINNKGDNNINTNVKDVKGNVYINISKENLSLMEINKELMERLKQSQNQITTLLEIIKNLKNEKT